jgi:hypothetical protein
VEDAVLEDQSLLAFLEALAAVEAVEDQRLLLLEVLVHRDQVVEE